MFYQYVLTVQAKVIPASITHVGLKFQFLMDVLLACDFSNVKQFVTSFKVNGQDIFVFPNMCHMLKLARNFICDEYEFLDGNDRTISWKYFARFDVNKAMEGVFFNDDINYEHEYEETDSLIDEEETDSVIDDDAGNIDDEDIDLGQVEDIVKKYYNLIK